MSSFNYIESAIILHLDTKARLRSFKFTAKDFVEHGDAYSFLLDHLDNYQELPSFDMMVDKYETLDKTAKNSNFDYVLQGFRDQVLNRKIIKLMKIDNKKIF